jgi:hypothetical protein
VNRLRDLPADQQVALLFVALFGLLALATVALLLWSVRHEDHPAAARLRRDLGSLWVGTCVFWAAWISGPLGATLLFGVLSFLALRELITLVQTRRGDHRSLILAFFVILPLQYVLVGTRRFDLFTVMIPVYAFLAIPVASALAGDPQRFLERNAKIQWGIMVCVYGLSHAPALLLLDLNACTGAVPSSSSFSSSSAPRRNWCRRRPAAGCAGARWRATSTARFPTAPGPWARSPPGSRVRCCTGSRLSSRRRRWPWVSSPAAPAPWANW